MHNLRNGTVRIRQEGFARYERIYRHVAHWRMDPFNRQRRRGARGKGGSREPPLGQTT